MSLGRPERETGRGSGSGSNTGGWVPVIAMAIVMVLVMGMGSPDRRATAPLNLLTPSCCFPCLIRTPGPEGNEYATCLKQREERGVSGRLGFLKGKLVETSTLQLQGRAQCKMLFREAGAAKTSRLLQAGRPTFGVLPAGVQEAERANANP